jgi:hypothetical protein
MIPPAAGGETRQDGSAGGAEVHRRNQLCDFFPINQLTVDAQHLVILRAAANHNPESLCATVGGALADNRFQPALRSS